MARRDERGTSALAVLLGLLVLGVFAFAAGGLVGLLWRDPQLMFAYLRGDTTGLEWETTMADVKPMPTPSVAAPPTDELAVEPVEVPAPPAAAKQPPIPEVAAAPPPSDVRFAIQVGAFAERSGAERLRGELESEGLPAYLSAGTSAGNARWRVRVGPYPDRTRADAVASRLKRTRQLPTWVLNEDTE